MHAQIDDSSGNTGSTSIQVTVDSEPVQVAISSPAHRLITKDASIEVTGTVGTGADTVVVNGTPAQLNGSAFSAMVPLREGRNMLIAVATKASGRTGSASVDIWRDIVAPIVRIQTPSDGFVSANPVVTVTGVVNDIVNGGVDPTISVNGIPATIAGGSFVVIDLPIVRGPNQLRAVAVDGAGNEAVHGQGDVFRPPQSSSSRNRVAESFRTSPPQAG